MITTAMFLEIPASLQQRLQYLERLEPLPFSPWSTWSASCLELLEAPRLVAGPGAPGVEFGNGVCPTVLKTQALRCRLVPGKSMFLKHLQTLWTKWPTSRTWPL